MSKPKVTLLSSPFPDEKLWSNQIRMRPSVKKLAKDFSEANGLTLWRVIEHCILSTLHRRD